MYANRYAPKPPSRRPCIEDPSLQDTQQPATTERVQRYSQSLEGHGLEVRTEVPLRVKTDIRWLG